LTALRVGVDLIEIERVRRALERHGDGFRDRCFTQAEREYCDSKPNPAQHYAGRFAAKEAVGKALGVGVYFTWKEIEIRGRPKPGVFLSGRTARAAERLGAGEIELSMTHSRELAAAVAVVLDGSDDLPRPEPGLAGREARRG
jgi:holo-[acyl-carrier protein] synthase